MKIWLIIGASQGLGFAAVKYLLCKGQIVIAVSNNETLDSVLCPHPNLEIISLDITNDNAVRNAIDCINSNYGQIDVLINNAIEGISEAMTHELQLLGIRIYYY